MNARERVELDIRGQICPSCMLLTLKALNTNAEALRAGRTEVVIETDDRQAAVTIPTAVDRMGYRAVVQRHDKNYRIQIFSR